MLIFRILTLKILLVSSVFAQSNTVLVGINHPYFPRDDKALPRLADSLRLKSSFVDSVYTFSTGQELLTSLKDITKKCGAIGNLVLYGHSGYEGYFVKQNSGFHRDNYYRSQKAKHVFLSKEAALVSDLLKAVERGQIVFDKSAVIILAGCNTGYGEENIALDLADALNIPVAGSNQKVDLYNVANKGEEMRGVESKTFFIYFPLESEIVKYDIECSVLTISQLFEIAFAKRALLFNDICYTTCLE